MKFKLCFLSILVSLMGDAHGMESGTWPLVVFLPALYTNAEARAYCNKFALKFLTNTQSEVHFGAFCETQRPIRQDSIKTALVHAFRPLAGIAAGSAVYAFHTLIDETAKNTFSYEVKEIIKATGQILIAGNALQYIPVSWPFKTDGYQILECIRAIKRKKGWALSNFCPPE